MPQTLDQDLRVWAADLLAELDLELYDVEHVGNVLRIVVDREGGVGLDEIARLTRGLSPILDEHDPIASAYTLEVSSPGLERRLRTPEHWAGALDAEVKVKLHKGVAEDRRVSGTVIDVDATSVTVLDEAGDQRQIAFTDIDSARTVYEWEAAPKPGSPAARKAKARRAAAEQAKAARALASSEPPSSPTPKKASS